MFKNNVRFVKTNVESCWQGQELVEDELKTKMEEINNNLEQNLKMKNITKY